MTRRIIQTPDAPGADGRLPFSQAVRAAGLLFVSGHRPFHPPTGEVVGETVEEQLRQCLTNVEASSRRAAARSTRSGRPRSSPRPDSPLMPLSAGHGTLGACA